MVALGYLGYMLLSRYLRSSWVNLDELAVPPPVLEKSMRFSLCTHTSQQQCVQPNVLACGAEFASHHELQYQHRAVLLEKFTVDGINVCVTKYSTVI